VFFSDRARIALLQETFSDRGEGAELATRVANQALFYPLEVAERATTAWGQPNEAAYRRVLDALRPSRMLGSLVAKGQPTDRKERIYETRYSIVEETGAGYEALANPVKMNGFALPKANQFMPAQSNLLSERPVMLINESALQMHYAQDTEFLRPTTSLVMRFVPLRETATAENMALMRLMELTLNDSMADNLGDAALAGITFGSQLSADGFRVSITGLGDSAPRFAQFFAGHLRSYTVTPQRFEAMKEIALRSIKSYSQTEAFRLAGNRRDAFSREFFFLPPEQLIATEKASLQQVQDYAKRYFAKGRLEVLVHGNLGASEAVKVIREIATQFGTAASAEKDLLRRRHTTQKANEHIIDAGPIEGANSALIMDYLLSDETPATRATALVLSNFFGQPFYSELRTRQQLGYVVGSSSTASLRQRYLTFVVQSTDYGPVQLRERAEAFIATLPALLAATSDAQWQSLIAGARSNLEEKPKSIDEKADNLFSLAYEFNGEWERRALAIDELNKLTKDQAIALLTRTLSGVQRRSIMLYAKKHEQGNEVTPTFTDRATWKAGREYR
jgi:insulysin